MALLNLFISLFLFISITLPIYAQKHCKSSNCSISGPEIKFPFLLKDRQDESCGYPGFNLTCNNQGKVAIDLPFSGRFFIREINYNKQIIKFYDPDNCVPGRIILLNLSGSPFTYQTQNYYFFSCPGNFTRYDFNDLALTWDRPQCGLCESSGGICVFRSGSLDVNCSFPGKVLKALLIIFLATLIPTSVIISCYWLCTKCNKENPQEQELNDNSTHINLGSLATPTQSSTPTPPQSSTPTTKKGLDESIIQSYPKVIIGESNLSPGLNNKTCPICLSEFLAKETVRFIPNCTHCFHSDCIDEWLRLNHSCPVCRISLTHVNI